MTIIVKYDEAIICTGKTLFKAIEDETIHNGIKINKDQKDQEVKVEESRS